MGDVFCALCGHKKVMGFCKCPGSSSSNYYDISEEEKMRMAGRIGHEFWGAEAPWGDAFNEVMAIRTVRKYKNNTFKGDIRQELQSRGFNDAKINELLNERPANYDVLEVKNLPGKKITREELDEYTRRARAMRVEMPEITTDDTLRTIVNDIPGVKMYYDDRPNRINYTDERLLPAISIVANRLKDKGVGVHECLVKKINPETRYYKPANVDEDIKIRTEQYGPPQLEILLTVDNVFEVADLQFCLESLYPERLEPVIQTRWTPIDDGKKTFIGMIFFKTSGKWLENPLGLNDKNSDEIHLDNPGANWLKSPKGQSAARLPNVLWCPKCNDGKGKFVRAVLTPDGGTLMCPYCYHLFGKRFPRTRSEKLKGLFKKPDINNLFGLTKGHNLLEIIPKILIFGLGMFLFIWELMTFGGGDFGGEYWFFAIIGTILGLISMILDFVEEEEKKEEIISDVKSGANTENKSPAPATPEEFDPNAGGQEDIWKRAAEKNKYSCGAKEEPEENDEAETLAKLSKNKSIGVCPTCGKTTYYAKLEFCRNPKCDSNKQKEE